MLVLDLVLVVTHGLGWQGLLQSEVEGDDDESVGFYGRCLHHSMNHHFVPDSRHLDSCNADPGEKKLTCARTEVCHFLIKLEALQIREQIFSYNHASVV